MCSWSGCCRGGGSAVPDQEDHDGGQWRGRGGGGETHRGGPGHHDPGARHGQQDDRGGHYQCKPAAHQVHVN